MNRKTTVALTAGLAAAMLASCCIIRAGSGKSNGQEENKMATDISPKGSSQDLVSMNNEFALKLFRETAGLESQVVSPLSITYLIGMLANGADGKTLDEIRSVLGWEGVPVEDINTFCRNMIENSGKLDPSTTINIADYIAVNKEYKLKTDFTESIQENYKAGIESLDFSSSKTLGHINSWCRKQTDGMIPGILDEVDPGAVAYIMNAIYFNGSWADKFSKKKTAIANFKGYTRDIKKVDMMHRNGKYEYTSNETYSAVRIPYGDGTFSMLVLLPNEGKSIDDILDKVDAQSVSLMGRSMGEYLVDLKLPKFTTEVEIPLNEIVSSLGAPSMFVASDADFSRMADGDIFISKMLQKAKIEVSEEGTKAAAVTAAVMVGTSLEPYEPQRVDFHADHPFIYIISESYTGAIYFIGQFAGD